MSVVKPISKTLPVGLCRSFATGLPFRGRDRYAVCLQSGLKEPSLKRCLCGRGCECYDPEWYGFEVRDGG